MKSYKLMKAGEFGLVSVSDTVYDDKFAKVKVLKAGISNSDIALFRGDKKGATYPITPSHQAMGVVSEIVGEDASFSKSDRVFISPYIKCGNCIPCLEGDPQKCEDMRMFGLDTDGFLADFVIVPVANLYRLPDAVDKDKAMFINYVALSKTVLDKLKIEKGEHVVITGASKLGNILAQLTIYYQGVPILVDEDESMLARAREDGIYYTVNPKTQDAKKIIKEITGNRMAENVVYLTNSRISVENAMEFSGYNSFMVIVGAEKDFSGNFKSILQKQLRVSGVNNGCDNILSAINLLANKTVNISNLYKESIPFDAVPEKFKEWAADEKFHFQITVDC